METLRKTQNKRMTRTTTVEFDETDLQAIEVVKDYLQSESPLQASARAAISWSIRRVASEISGRLRKNAVPSA